MVPARESQLRNTIGGCAQADRAWRRAPSRSALLIGAEIGRCGARIAVDVSRRQAAELRSVGVRPRRARRCKCGSIGRASLPSVGAVLRSRRKLVGTDVSRRDPPIAVDILGGESREISGGVCVAMGRTADEQMGIPSPGFLSKGFMERLCPASLAADIAIGPTSE